MFVVVFESTSFPSQAVLSDRYYAQTQKLLLEHPGFISEAPYGSLDDENQGLLVGKFSDEAAAQKWRLQHDHLRIQRSARRLIFEDYRLRCGPAPNIGAADNGQSGHSAVVLYERPRAEAESASSLQPGTVDAICNAESLGSDLCTRMKDLGIYQSEQGILWLSGWTSIQAAGEFVETIARVEGDEVNMFQVVREYGKYDGREAPPGADEAQEASIKP